MSTIGLIRLLGLAAEAAITGAKVATVVKATRAMLDTMEAENRDPTREEWDAKLASMKSLHEQIQGA